MICAVLKSIKDNENDRYLKKTSSLFLVTSSKAIKLRACMLNGRPNTEICKYNN